MDQTQAFYLTLPSSVQIYSLNIVTNFITQLPNSLFLDGDWEAELTEIPYPYTWNSIRSGKNKAYIKAWEERDYTSLEIPTGYYDKINNVIYNLKVLMWTPTNFGKDDLDIRFYRQKNICVCKITAVTCDSKMMLPQSWDLNLKQPLTILCLRVHIIH